MFNTQMPHPPDLQTEKRMLIQFRAVSESGILKFILLHIIFINCLLQEC